MGIIFALLFAVNAAPAHAQSELPAILEMQTTGAKPLRLLRVNHEGLDIEIDGHINEPIWQRIVPFGGLRVIEPDTIALPAYDTDIRIFYTERGLYVAVDLEQPAETIVERIAPRDAFFVSRDFISFTIDTSGDGRYGYWFSMSLGDSEMDGTILPERKYNASSVQTKVIRNLKHCLYRRRWSALVDLFEVPSCARKRAKKSV